MWKVWNKTVKCKIHFRKWRLNHCFRHPGIFRNGNEKNVTTTTKMTTRYISFAPLKFLLRCFLKKKKAVEHTTTSVQDPLQIKFSLQFDKWQIKRAEIIETTIKNTNFEEKGHLRNLFFFNALCHRNTPACGGLHIGGNYKTMSIGVCIAHLFDLANILCYSPMLANTEKNLLTHYLFWK